MRSPAQFGGSKSLFIEAFDRPGVDELTDFLRVIADLGVAPET